MEEISTQQIDSLVKRMLEQKEIYENLKRLSSEEFRKYDELKLDLLTLLQKADKSKYHVEGLGTVSVVGKAKVRVPKDPTAKKEMLQYFQAQGEEVFSQYVTVNYNSLNSWYNQELEQNPLFRIPGVEQPKPEFDVRFRK